MKKLIVIIGCAIYVISPIDIIPDIIAVLGWLDDLAVIGGTVKYLSKRGGAAVKEVG